MRWSVAVSSPMMVGTDIRLMTPIMKELLLNKETIAINQVLAPFSTSCDCVAALHINLLVILLCRTTKPSPGMLCQVAKLLKVKTQTQAKYGCAS